MTQDKLYGDIHGSGGGGGGSSEPRQPDYTPDDPNLKSISFAQIQYLICEGEITGPAYGNTIEGLEQSVFLDDTPIRSGNSTTPTPDDLVFSWGRPHGEQTGVPGMGRVSSAEGVDKAVLYNLPISQTITVSDADATYYGRVMLTWSGLYLSNNDGLYGTDVSFLITYADALNVTRTIADTYLSSKFAGQFQREFEFKYLGPPPWRITVSRRTPDDDARQNGSNTYRSAFQFTSVITSLDQRFSYPNCSILTVGLRADQFSAIPEVSIELIGQIIKVPTNYDSTSRTYATTGAGTTNGVWNGTLKEADSNNPAWILYDAITQDRYGLGNYIYALPDIWTLYEIGKYCDELVPAAGGGYEPRFTCNVVFQNSEEAWTVLQQLSSIFRGMLYCGGSSIVAVQDRPKPYVFTFNPSNTIEEVSDDNKISKGNFNYKGPARRARHTVILASWDDPTDKYQPRIEYMADEEALERYGYRSMDLRLLGVTSRGQALRAANAALLGEKYLDDTCVFSSNEIGAVVRPFDQIKIADPDKNPVRLGGRIIAVNGAIIKVDKLPTLKTWKNATFGFMSADSDNQPIIETHSVVENSMNFIANTLQLNTIPVNPPEAGWPFIIETPNDTAQSFRILSVEEQDDGTHSFTALKYNPDIYSMIDNQTPLSETDDYRYTFGTPKSPTISLAQVVWGNNQVYLKTQWLPPKNKDSTGSDITISSYRIQYLEGIKLSDGTYEWETTWYEMTTQYDYEEAISLPNYTYGTYFKVRVNATNSNGYTSAWSEIVIADDITVSTPMPNLAEGSNASLTHTNLASGAQQFVWSITTTGLPGYVRGSLLRAKPGRTLTGGESLGLSNLDADGWYDVATLTLSGQLEFRFYADTTWQLRLYLRTAITGLSSPTYASNNVDVQEIIPPTPTDLAAVTQLATGGSSYVRRFTWNLPTPFYSYWPLGYVSDIARFQLRYIAGTTPNWEQGLVLITEGVPGSQHYLETAALNNGIWTVMIKSQDNAGWLSNQYAFAVLSLGDTIPTNVVETINLKELDFVGAYTNSAVDTKANGDSYLKQVSAASLSYFVYSQYITKAGSSLSITTTSSGTYQWELRMLASSTSDLVYQTPLTESLYSSNLDDLFYISIVPGQETAWHTYSPGEIILNGYYDFRMTFNSVNGTTAAEVTETSFIFDYPDIIETFDDQTVTATGRTFTFTNTFTKLKTLTFGLQVDSNTGVGSTVQVLSRSAQEFTIKVLNSSGQAITGVIDAIAVGY